MRKLAYSITNQVLVSLIAVLILGVLDTAVSRIHLLDPLYRSINNFHLSDMFFQIMADSGEDTESSLITIVDISELHDRGQIANVINEINKYDPQVLGIDVIFEGLKGDTIGSDKLADAILNTSQPVVAFQLTQYDNNKETFTKSRHSFFTTGGDINEGFSNIESDILDGSIRKIQSERNFQGHKVGSLSYEIAKAFDSEVVKVQPGSGKRMIDYSPTKFPTIRYDSIAENSKLLQGHIVILGCTHEEQDMHYSPYGRTPGVIIQAYAVQTFIENKQMDVFSNNVATFVSFFLVLLTQIFKKNLSNLTTKYCNDYVRYVFNLPLVQQIINFIWIVLLIWIDFLIFVRYGYYLSFTAILLSTALLGDAETVYNSTLNVFKPQNKANGNTVK